MQKADADGYSVSTDIGQFGAVMFEVMTVGNATLISSKTGTMAMKLLYGPEGDSSCKQSLCGWVTSWKLAGRNAYLRLQVNLQRY